LIYGIVSNAILAIFVTRHLEDPVTPYNIKTTYTIAVSDWLEKTQSVIKNKKAPNRQMSNVKTSPEKKEVIIILH